MAAVVPVDELLHLLKASSKADVIDICQKAFGCRNTKSPPESLVKNVASKLSIEPSEASKLLITLSSLIRKVLFNDVFTPEAISSLFPPTFHKQLRDLLVQIFIEHSSSWRSATVNSLVSLPKLREFDWRVNIKLASSDISRMNTPTCILRLEVQNGTNENSSTTFEMSKETLETMLDGLGRIRDQLNAVAKK